MGRRGRHTYRMAVALQRCRGSQRNQSRRHAASPLRMAVAPQADRGSQQKHQSLLPNRHLMADALRGAEDCNSSALLGRYRAPSLMAVVLWSRESQPSRSTRVRCSRIWWSLFGATEDRNLTVCGIVRSAARMAVVLFGAAEDRNVAGDTGLKQTPAIPVAHRGGQGSELSRLPAGRVAAVA